MWKSCPWPNLQYREGVWGDIAARRLGKMLALEKKSEGIQRLVYEYVIERGVDKN